MKRLFHIALFCLVAVSLHAQAVDSTVCDILKDPQSFNGKTVRIKGTVSSGFDELIIKAEDCRYSVSGIWLAYPEGTKAKNPGPVAILQLQPAGNFAGTIASTVPAPVSLDKSKDFKQFDSLLAASYKGNGMCLGCTKSEVSATLTGRLDAVQRRYAAMQQERSSRSPASATTMHIRCAWCCSRFPMLPLTKSTTPKSPQSPRPESTSDAAAGSDATASVHGFAKVFGPAVLLATRLNAPPPPLANKATTTALKSDSVE